MSAAPIALTLTRRQRLWFAAQGKCHWCACMTRILKQSEPDQATIDHVIPMGRGGSNDDDNVVLACNACNQRRNREDQVSTKSPDAEDKAWKAEAMKLKHVVVQRDQALQRIAELEEMAFAPLWKIAARRMVAWAGRMRTFNF